MSTTITTDDAISRVASLLADAPAHVRERWNEVETYLSQAEADKTDEIATAVPHEDDLLAHVSVSARMFSGASRTMEIVLEFPFDIRSWFDGRSHFEFEPAESGRSEDQRMVDFYQRQEAERKQTLALIRSSVAPVIFDCLRRLVAQDARRGKDEALYGLRHATWLSGDRSGPKPYPAGGQPERVVSMVDGVIIEHTA